MVKAKTDKVGKLKRPIRAWFRTTDQMDQSESCISYSTTVLIHNERLSSLQCRRLVGAIELALSLRPPLDAMLDGGGWGRGKMRRLSSPHPLPYSFSCLSLTPLVELSFSLQSSPAGKIQYGGWTLRCERSLEEISPALQARDYLDNLLHIIIIESKARLVLPAANRLFDSQHVSQGQWYDERKYGNSFLNLNFANDTVKRINARETIYVYSRHETGTSLQVRLFNFNCVTSEDVCRNI